MSKPDGGPCAAAEKGVREATRRRFACDEQLRAAGSTARDWSKRAQDFAGTDMWSPADRRAATQAEREVEVATSEWSKAQVELDKARKLLEACRKRNGG